MTCDFCKRDTSDQFGRSTIRMIMGVSICYSCLEIFASKFKPITEGSITYELELPYPVSDNALHIPVRTKYGAKKILSDEGRNYYETVHRIIKYSGIPKILGDATFYCEAFPPDKRVRDTPNLLKCVLDSLKDNDKKGWNGIVKDDRQFVDTRIKKMTVVKGGKLIVRIEEIKE